MSVEDDRMVWSARRAAAFPRRLPSRREGGTEVENEESKPSCRVVNLPSVIPSRYPAYHQYRPSGVMSGYQWVEGRRKKERRTSEYLDASLSYSTLVNGSVAPP